MNPDQFLLPLVHTVTPDRAHSLVCIPDRISAECELTKIRREYGARLLKATIHNDRPPESNPRARTTYTSRCYR